MFPWQKPKKPKEQMSLANLQFLHGILVKNPVVNKSNSTQITECLRQIAELMVWGDKHNPAFFDFFCANSMMSMFVQTLHQPCDAKVKIQVIQSLSILIQNTQSEMSVFYLLSNNYINDLIVHRFDFSNEELLAYYISFLKALSLKLNERTIHFFFNSQANDFPLYTEAVKFFNNPEAMVRVAVRTLSLNVFAVNDSLLRIFLRRSSITYFSNLIWFVRDKCITLNERLESVSKKLMKRSEFDELIEEQLDFFFYLQDIIHLGIHELSNVLIDQILGHLLLPVLVGSLRENPQRGHSIKLRLALYLLCKVFYLFEDESLINALVVALLDPNPPFLISYIVEHPPTHAVKGSNALAAHMYPGARFLPSNDSPQQTDTTEAEVKPSAGNESSQKKEAAGGGFGAIATPTNALAEALSKIEAPDGAGQTADGEEEPKEKEDDPSRPVDENLKARSRVPETGPVTDLVQLCDEMGGWKPTTPASPPNPETVPPSQVRGDRNPYREAVFDALHHPDERVIFYAVSLLIAIKANKSVHKKLLAKAGLLPVDHTVAPLPSDGTSDDEKNAKSAKLPDKRPLIFHNHLLFEKLMRPLTAERPLRFITVQLISKLILDVFHSIESRTTSLSKAQLQQLTRASSAGCRDLVGIFQGALGGLLLDTFEDAWFYLQNHRLDPKAASSNSLSLVPIVNEQSLGSGGSIASGFLEEVAKFPLAFRLPSKEMEKAKAAAYIFICLRMLRFKLENIDDPTFPAAFSHASEDSAGSQEQHSPMLAPILSVPADIDLNGKDIIECTAAINYAKSQFFLVIHPTQFVLVHPHPSKPGHAVAQMACSLHHQEAFFNRNNKSVLHVVIRSSKSPHPACRMLKEGAQEPGLGVFGRRKEKSLWNLTLLFSDHVQCASALRHLDQARVTLRKRLLSTVSDQFKGPAAP